MLDVYLYKKIIKTGYPLYLRYIFYKIILKWKGRQSFLYEWIPIVKLSQPGTYVGLYPTKARYQRESKHRGGPRSRPDPLLGHPPGCLLPIHTGVLAQFPHKRSPFSCLTGVRRHLPRGPSAHRDLRSPGQNKLKSHTTNGWSNFVLQSASQPWQWRHIGS